MDGMNELMNECLDGWAKEQMKGQMMEKRMKEDEKNSMLCSHQMCHSLLITCAMLLAQIKTLCDHAVNFTVILQELRLDDRMISSEIM